MDNRWKKARAERRKAAVERNKREAERKARLAPDANKAVTPAEENKAPAWHLKSTPEEYLDRYPEGPNADLARKVIRARA